MIDKSTNVELSTEAPLVANPCYVQPFSETFLEDCIQFSRQQMDWYMRLEEFYNTPSTNDQN